MIRFLLTLGLLLFVHPVGAQTQMKVYLEDGSVIRCTSLVESLHVDTAYGTLVVPFCEVKRIQFGLHPSPVESKALADARRGIASGVYKDREISRKTMLSMGRLSIPVLRAASKSSDREVSAASASILQTIVERDPREVRELDSIVASFLIDGRIKTESLAVRSALGESTIPLGKIESLVVVQPESSFSLNTPSIVDSVWVATGFTVDRGDVVTIAAGGEIDLYPSDPGKWKAGPRGYNTAGKGGQFLAGALIGKIGNGSPFVVGESMTIGAQETGELHLQIVASPWNNISTGSYAIRIRSGR